MSDLLKICGITSQWVREITLSVIISAFVIIASCFMGIYLLLQSDSFEMILLSVIITTSVIGVIGYWINYLKSQETMLGSTRMEAQLFKLSPIPQIIYDRVSSKIVSCNKQASIYPWSHNLEKIKEYIDIDSYDKFISAINFNRAKVFDFELNHGDIAGVWQFSLNPRDEVIFISFENITSDFHKKTRIVAKQKILNTMFEGSRDGIFSVDQNGLLIAANANFAEWLGYEAEEILGMPFVKLLAKPPKDLNLDSSRAQNITGYTDFITSSKRTKSAYLEQNRIEKNGQTITLSVIRIATGSLAHDDMNKLLNMAPIPVVFLDDNGLVKDFNGLFRDKFWNAKDDPRGRSIMSIVLEQDHKAVEDVFKAVTCGVELEAPLEVRLNYPEEGVASVYVAYVSECDSRPGGLFLQFHDITEQKKLETQLVQSQKMQAVGQLAGGIAHDFNNLLTAMIGFCDLLLQRFTPGDQSFTELMQIKQNANRAANLVRQLLAFSRQQTLQPKLIDVTECLSELSALLRRLIGSNIELKFKHSRDIGLVMVDKGQLEQVLINMIVNARDAMPSGGTITIATGIVDLKKPRRKGSDTIPVGSYVTIEITDTGTGIEPENMDRIFDPFFSTKQVGEGTGLGLSTVYGIVKQTGGFTMVDSELGKGSKFTVYLPKHMAKVEPQVITETKVKPLDLTGHHHILLVEDEDAVRLFSARALRSKGYKVIEARDGLEALGIIKNNRDEKIDLVISDVVMPNMDGPTFVNQISEEFPGVKVIFISGYTEDTFRDRLKHDQNIQFLAKPFSLGDLASKVKEVLADGIQPMLEAC